jgi:hypothetical protein
MDTKQIEEKIEQLGRQPSQGMHLTDFLLTWEKSAAEITGVSCRAGEVTATVFDRYRDPLYAQAGYKPYIGAAMILLARLENPAAKLFQHLQEPRMRVW